LAIAWRRGDVDRWPALDGLACDTWEGVARATHLATGIDAPVDARELAEACGLRLEPTAGSGATLIGEVIRYDAAVRGVRQHGLIAHEVAHYVLRFHGEDDTEEAARYTAAALILPKSTFNRDLQRTAWDLEKLRQLHPNASAQMISRRISELREAVITVLDQGRVTSRVASPWMPLVTSRLTNIERELADAALETGEPQRANDLLAAYPLIDGMHRRVIVIAEARQLSLKL
jgi:hypothetical protein